MTSVIALESYSTENATKLKKIDNCLSLNSCFSINTVMITSEKVASELLDVSVWH